MDELRLLIEDVKCGRCGGCVAVCGPNALYLDAERLHERAGACTACKLCLITCPSKALVLKDDE